MFSHEYFFEFSIPAFTITLRISSLFNIVSFCKIESMSNLSINNAVFPITSFIYEILSASTGHPARWASITVIPKPSYEDG